jgi:HlyD family secretion protein
MRTARMNTRISPQGIIGSTSLLACMGLASFLLLGCEKKEATPTPVVEVQAATVTNGSITENLEADAVLAPVAQAAIAPKITAPVSKFLVQRGSTVHEGQLLAVLENKDLAAAREDNQGTYHSAQATYEVATKAQIPEDAQKAELDLEQAQANLSLNQKIVESRKQLFAQGAIPGRDLDTAQAALVQAQASYDAAKKHLDSMTAVSHEAAMRNAKGQLESAEGKFEGSEAQLSYSEIRSPINGVVTDRPLFAGETAPAGQTLLTVMDTSNLLAKAHVPQSQAQILSLGTPATVHVPGLEEPVEGKVTLISPALDPGSTTVEVWVKVENPKGILKAGTSVHLSIHGRMASNVLLVPKNALVKDATGKSVLMVIGSDSIAHAAPVQVGIEDDTNLQIISGVKAGQQIAVAGAYALDDGTKIKIASTDEKKSAGKDAGEDQ